MNGYMFGSSTGRKAEVGDIVISNGGKRYRVEQVAVNHYYVTEVGADSRDWGLLKCTQCSVENDEDNAERYILR